MEIKDVAGRINSEHLTPEEWQLLAELSGKTALDTGEYLWIVPTEKQWAACIGLLAMVEIRRGARVMDRGIQLGYAQIRLGEHGKKALEAKAQGRVYTYGDKLSTSDAKRLMVEYKKQRKAGK